MKILLTNDDGYRCEGFLQLAVALAKEHEIFLCAPMREQSGAGHSLSFVRRLYYERIDTLQLTSDKPYSLDAPCYAVEGSPADATKFAIEHIYKDEKFDVVISGINTVLNVGTDTIYSGTFNAAEEATVLGLNGIAVSTVNKNDDYSFPVEFIVKNLNSFMKSMRPMVTINVNIPSAVREENKGVAIVPLGLRRYNDWYERAEDGGYQLTGYTIDCANNEYDDDCKLSDKGYITISPVRVISLDEDLLDELKEKDWTL